MAAPVDGSSVPPSWAAVARAIPSTRMRHPVDMRPTLVINPRSDAAFVAAVDRDLEDGADSPEALEDRLRSRFPNVRVRERSLSNESIVTWYIYKEGSWIPNPDR